jgi:large conductance mechanosensitive channel
MVAEFRAFLLKHNVMAVAIGFILGAAVGKVVTALVTDLIMPIVGAFTPAGDWRTMTMQIGNATFLVGDFLGALLDFFIIAVVVFLIGKALLRPGPSPETKNCPACAEIIAKEARRCKYCTEVLAGA